MKAKLGSTNVLWEAGELSMEVIKHVGIAVSRANGCHYCTGAFCTILDYGLGADDDYVQRFAAEGRDAIDDERTRRSSASPRGSTPTPPRSPTPTSRTCAPSG